MFHVIPKDSSLPRETGIPLRGTVQNDKWGRFPLTPTAPKFATFFFPVRSRKRTTNVPFIVILSIFAKQNPALPGAKNLTTESKAHYQTAKRYDTLSQKILHFPAKRGSRIRGTVQNDK